MPLEPSTADALSGASCMLVPVRKLERAGALIRDIDFFCVALWCAACRVSSDTFESRPIRLLLLLSPGANQRFQFRLLDGSSKAELGSVVLNHQELMASTPKSQPFKLKAAAGGSKAPAAAAAEEVDALAEQLYGDMSMRLTVVGAPAGAGAGAGVAGSQSAQQIRWAQFGSFDRSASRAALTGQASTFEVELAVSGLFSFDALSKASPVVSVHASGSGAPVDHTEVAPSTHHASFQQMVLLQPGAVLRVYDVSAGTALDDSSLIGSTAPLNLTQLEAGVELELTNPNPGPNKRLQKKGGCIRIVSITQVGSSAMTSSSSAASPKNQQPASSPKASSSAASPKSQQPAASSPKAAAPTPKASPKGDATSAAGLQVQVPPPVQQPSVSSRTPVVAASSTPFDASTLSFTASQIVLVDETGKEHRVAAASVPGSGSKSPKSPSSSAAAKTDSVSLNVSARNLPKVQALSSNISPLVAIWERVGCTDTFVLLGHTEPVANQSDPAFAATLTINLSAANAASPKAGAASGPGDYRIDVYDVSEPRVQVQSDRVGLAYCSRADLLSLGASADFSAEKVFPLSHPSNARLEKKLQARRSVVVLVRAGAPVEQVAQRELVRSKSLVEKKAARDRASAKLQAKRTGIPLPDSPKPVEPVPAAAAAPEPVPVPVSAVVVEPVVAEHKQPEAAQPEQPQLAVPSGLPPTGKAAGSSAGAGSRRGSFNVGYAGVSGGSRRGSFSSGADGESTADMDDALLAEKVAAARVLEAKAAVDAFHGAGKKNRVAEERHAAEADLRAAEAELVAASERAATAKKELAARRKARAEAAEAESKRKAEADAAAAATGQQTLWGMRKRGPSMHNIPHISGGGGSARHSPAGSMSLSGDLESVVTARRMAAQNPAAQAQLALLGSHAPASCADSSAPSTSAGKSCVLCLNVSVQNIKNSGAWNPLVAFYERAAAPAASAASAAESYVYLDSTEKISGVGETGSGRFHKQVLLEVLSGGAHQSLRVQLFNAGAKDEALSGADLIGSGSISLAQLMEATTGDRKGQSVEVYLFSAHNHALSERLKRQHASVVLSVAAVWEAPAGTAGAEAKHSLILGSAPVPLVMEGGADPDPSATTFAAVTQAPSSAAEPTGAAFSTAAGDAGAAETAAVSEAAAAPAAAALAPAAKESPAGSRDASDNEAEDASAATPAAGKKKNKKNKKKAGK